MAATQKPKSMESHGMKIRMISAKLHQIDKGLKRWLELDLPAVALDGDGDTVAGMFDPHRPRHVTGAARAKALDGNHAISAAQTRCQGRFRQAGNGGPGGSKNDRLHRIVAAQRADNVDGEGDLAQQRNDKQEKQQSVEPDHSQQH